MAESSLYPTALDSTNIYEVVARLSTTLTADITAATTTIPLAATTGFPTQGYIVIDNETIKYISVSVGSVDATGGRGHAGTAASHTNTTQVLVAVTAAVINKLRAGMIAVQTKVGISGSADTTSHDYKLSGVTGSGKAVNNAYAETIAGVKTLTSPVINTGVSGTAIDTDGTLAANSDTLLASQKAVKTYVVANASPADGWIAASETWTYVSIDGTTGVFNVNADVTAKHSVGMRVKYTQTTVKYGIITAVGAYAAEVTPITIWGGTDYTLANAAITSPYYSTQKAPFGFPLNPTKWTVQVTDVTARAQGTPTTNTWYNLGSITISIPIGVWDTNYSVAFAVYIASATVTTAACTLSTANNSESDVDFTTANRINAPSGALFIGTPAFKSKILALAAKTSYYLNTRTDQGAGEISNQNDRHKLIINAVCAYL